MDRNTLEQLLKQFPDLKILVVGDLVLDEYLWGRTERISPEAPVQVVDVLRQELRLGGAGNAAHNLAAVGCRVEIASVLGDDADGREIQALLSGMNIGTEGIFITSQRATSRKTRILASNQQMLRIDRESRETIRPREEEQLIHFISERANGCQAILVSDYRKGVLTDALLARIFAIGHESGVPVLVDPKGDDFSRYRGATLLTPNRKEASAATGIPLEEGDSLLRAGRQLRKTLDLEALVLTRSEEGMTLFHGDDQEDHLPTEAKEVFDVSGAGDTVLAFLGIGLAGGWSLTAAARLANLAAGVVVGKVGTSTVSAAELLAAAARRADEGDRKIPDRQLLGTILAEERRRGQRIVFTNGCFDLLHVGHVRYLQQARQLGDLLVLGLNSDASVRRLKGPQRPLIGEEERAHILSALHCVDYVVLFDEDTPLELIRALRPQVLVKGGDYTPDEVVGRELVEGWGGRVEIIPFEAGHSTTGLVEKILRQHRDE